MYVCIHESRPAASQVGYPPKSWDGDPTPGCEDVISIRATGQLYRVSLRARFLAMSYIHVILNPSKPYMRAPTKPLAKHTPLHVLAVIFIIEDGHYFRLLILLFPRGGKRKQGLPTPTPPDRPRSIQQLSHTHCGNHYILDLDLDVVV